MIRKFIKSWIFLLLIIISNLIIAVKTFVGFFYFFFWFLSSLVILSLGYLIIEYFLSKKLIFKRNVTQRMEEEDLLEIETVIENKGMFPFFNFVFQDYLSPAALGQRQKNTLIEYLGWGASISFKYDCFCSVRGLYNIGPVSIYFFDPLGLFFLKRTYRVYSELYVYPKTFSIRNFPLLKKGILPWFGIDSSRASGDEDEFFGIREYKAGDPIKRIHWISTARKNSLMVKQFQRQSFYRVTILFNLEKAKNYGDGKESVLEYTVKIVASLVRYFVGKDVSVEIIAHTGEVVHIPFNKGREHLEDIFKFLAGAQAESRVGLGEIFEEFYRFIPNDSNLIIVMLDQDWEHLMGMVSLEKRNVALLPLILVSSSFLNTSQQPETIKDVKIKLSSVFNFMPIFFSRGENLEDVFPRQQNY